MDLHGCKRQLFLAEVGYHERVHEDQASIVSPDSLCYNKDAWLAFDGSGRFAVRFASESLNLLEAEDGRLGFC